MSKHPSQGEQGQIALYALVSLPLALSLCVAAIDVTGALAARDELQREADRLALAAAQLLPDVGTASTFIDQSAARLRGVAHEREVTDSQITVTLTSRYDSMFDTFLGGRIGFKIKKISAAQVTPSDTVILLNDGSTLRPPLGTPWGDSALWPETGYFRCVTAPSEATSTVPDSSPSPLRYSDPEFRRSATQSCFNPVFSPLKYAAIELAESLGAISLNRIGVIVTPGNNPLSAGTVLRHIRGEATLDGATFFPGQVGGFASTSTVGPEAIWNPTLFVEPEALLGDEACALFSLYDDFGSARYQLPQPALPYGLKHARRNLLHPVAISPCGSPHFPFGRLSHEFLSLNVLLRQAIYWHSARAPEAGVPILPDVVATVRIALAELLVAGDERYVRNEVATRGQVAYQPQLRIVFLTDSLPTSSADFVTLINQIRDLRAKRFDLSLALVVFDPFGAIPSRDPLQALDPTEQILRVSLTRSADELQTSIIPGLIRGARLARLRS
jgi:hypothetical protein